MKCPKCGKERKNARQCPKQGGEPICTECCKTCEHHRETSYGNPCMWLISQPEYKEIEKLRPKAAQLKRKKELLWAKRMNIAATAVEAEWRTVVVEMGKLRDELNKKAGY